MQKNDLSIRNSETEKDFTDQFSLKSITACLERNTVFQTLGRLYSSMLHETVSSRQAVFFFYSQLSALGLFMPFHISLGWRMFFLLIFCYTMRKAYDFRPK